MKFFPRILTPLACAAALFAADTADACTRAVYLGPDDRILTGRSMDWKLPMICNLWAMPRGVARDGAAGDRSAQWIADYGSLVTTGYCSTPDVGFPISRGCGMVGG